MKNRLASAIALVLLSQSVSADNRPQAVDVTLRHLASISTDSIGTTGAEIVAYDARTRRAFAINSTDNDLAVLDLTDPSAPILEDKVSFDAYGAGLNSVATHDGLVAVAVEASPKTKPGQGRIHRCAHTADRGRGHRGRAARHADLRRRRQACAGGQRGRAELVQQA